MVKTLNIREETVMGMLLKYSSNLKMQTVLNAAT